MAQFIIKHHLACDGNEVFSMIKKFFLLATFLSFFCNSSFSEEYDFLGKIYYHPDSESSVQLTNDFVSFIWDNGSSIQKDGRKSKLLVTDGFTILSTNKEDFILLNISLNNNLNFISLINNAEGEWGKRIYIPFYYSNNEQISSSPVLQPVKVVKTSSYLKEKMNGKNIEYYPINYDGAFHLYNLPWVVTNTNNWIEFLVTPQFEDYSTDYLEVSQLVICNGYFYPGRLDLYKKNSRIKQIKLVYGEIDFITELKDIPGFQTINLPKSINVNKDTNFKLFIQSIYPGDKYKDIALSAILFPTARLK